MVTERRGQGALDDWTEYLCVRRIGSSGIFEIAVCGFTPDLDEYELDDLVADDSNRAEQDDFGPMTDDAVVELRRRDTQDILLALNSLGWPDSDLLAVQAAVETLSPVSNSSDTRTP